MAQIEVRVGQGEPGRTVELELAWQALAQFQNVVDLLWGGRAFCLPPRVWKSHPPCQGALPSSRIKIQGLQAHPCEE